MTAKEFNERYSSTIQEMMNSLEVKVEDIYEALEVLKQGKDSQLVTDSQYFQYLNQINEFRFENDLIDFSRSGLTADEEESLIELIQSSDFECPVPKTSIVKSIVKKTSTIIGLVTTSLMLGSCTPNLQEEPATNQTTDESIKEDPEEKILENSFTEMSEFGTNMVDQVSEMINVLLSRGIQIPEDQKELYAKLATEYYIASNIDEMSNSQITTLLQEEKILPEDIMKAYNTMNDLIKYQMLVVEPDNTIDFSLIFENKNDQQLLNEGNAFLSKLNNTTKNERKQAAKDFYDYIQSKLQDSQTRILYSDSALATFITTEVQAFDELTRSQNNGKGYYLDDELEHFIFTTYMDCIHSLYTNDDAELDVEQTNIATLQSKFVIGMKNRIMARSYYLHSDTLNPYDSIEQVIEKVEEKIDLQLYQEIEDYQEKMKNMAGVIDKGILNSNSKNTIPPYQTDTTSTGEVVNVTDEELKANGVVDPNSPIAIEEYKAKVEANFAAYAQTESGHVLKDDSGNILVSGGAVNSAEYTQGYNDAFTDGYEKRSFNPRMNTTSYLAGYTQSNYNTGKETRIIDEDSASKEEQSTTEFIPEKGEWELDDSKTEEHDFTNDFNFSSSEINDETTVYEETTIVEETTVEYDFTNDSYNYFSDETKVEQSTEEETKVEQSNEEYNEQAFASRITGLQFLKQYYSQNTTELDSGYSKTLRA